MVIILCESGQQKSVAQGKIMFYADYIESNDNKYYQMMDSNFQNISVNCN